MASVINQRLLNSRILDKLQLNKKYSNVKESKNLIAVFEHHLFVWHDNNSCILVAEINGSDAKNECFKTLTLTNPPVFDVESMLFNHTGTLIALNGKNGVMVFEVPWRYGKFGSPGSNEETIIGRSWNIAEYFFVCSNRIGVVQIAWHPGSATNTNLTVLSTDNYIRTYDVTDPQTPLQVVNLGANSKNSFLSSESKIPFSTCYGENVVSFDFGPPEEMQIPMLNSSRVIKSFEDVTVWLIFILHGNGDVYILKSPLVKGRSQAVSKVQGPLSMYPPTEDNYGYDACYILCLHTTPNCIVVATASGVIYHCVVLENPNLEPGNELDPSWEVITPDDCDLALFVFESVELPLSLTEEQDAVCSHPIRLYKDITSHTKYHCSHVSGLHSVGVPFLHTLENGFETDDLENLLTKELKQESIVEYMLCTKPFSVANAVPVLGLDVIVSDAGVTMICLLASCEFVCLPLVSSYFSSTPQLLSDVPNQLQSSDISMIQMFEKQIEKTLQRSVCSPYVKSQIDQTNTTPQQWLDLLCNVTQRFREDYIHRLTTAKSLLRSRIKVLSQQKEFQLRDIGKIQQEKDTLRLGAERLAERYDEAQTNQQKLLKRIETVLQKFQRSLPYLSKVEINMKETLISYEDKIEVFESSLELIRKKLKNQKEKMEETGNQVLATKTELANINLTERQIKHVKELLCKQAESIGNLKKTVTTLKKQTGA